MCVWCLPVLSYRYHFETVTGFFIHFLHNFWSFQFLFSLFYEIKNICNERTERTKTNILNKFYLMFLLIKKKTLPSDIIKRVSSEDKNGVVRVRIIFKFQSILLRNNLLSTSRLFTFRLA